MLRFPLLLEPLIAHSFPPLGSRLPAKERECVPAGESTCTQRLNATLFPGKDGIRAKRPTGQPRASRTAVGGA